MTMTEEKTPLATRILLGAIRLIAGLAIIWLLLVLLLFWPQIFHDVTRVDLDELARVLNVLQLGESDITLTDSYNGMPNWAGDYSRGFCFDIAAGAEPATGSFVPGDHIEDALVAPLKTYGTFAYRAMSSFVAAPETLMTQQYLVYEMYTGSSALHVIYLPVERTGACYWAIKF